MSLRRAGLLVRHCEQGPSLVVANEVKQSQGVARDKLRNLTLAFSKLAMVQKRKILGNLDWYN